MIKAFKNMGMCFVRLAKSLGAAFAAFGREMACAFRGCDGTDGKCCK